MNNNEAVQSAAEASIPQTGSNMGGEIIHDREFEKEVAEFISEHLPAKVYNAHFHITRGIDTSTEETILKGTGEQPVSGGSDAPFSDFLSFTSANIGSGRFESGLVLPKPGFLGAYRNPRFIADENAYNIALAEKHGLDAGLLVTPQCDPAESMSLLDGHTCIKALKPYWSYSVGKNLYESDILEYAPEWIWQCAHERGMPVVLHLSHTLNQLSDQGNISQLHYISSKYPRAKIVLAHSATGYNSLKSRKGLEAIKGLKNIWFDCSGAPDTIATFNCMRMFGPEHMMWGDDYDYSTFNGRIRGVGANYIGLSAEEMDFSNLYPDYMFRPMRNILEGVMSLFEACDLLGLDRSDTERVFYQNGKEFYK